MAYDRHPTIRVSGHRAIVGYDDLLAELSARVERVRAQNGGRCVLVCDSYPGVRDDEVISQMARLRPDVVVDTRALFPEPAELTRRMAPFLTDDRVFGRMCFGKLEEFMDARALLAARWRIEGVSGLVLVCGFGAALVHPGDVLVYLDATRWEIQLRYRAGMPNYGCDNGEEDALRKVKRGLRGHLARGRGRQDRR